MKKRFSTANLLILAGTAAVVFAVDKMIGAPVLLGLVVCATLPYVAIREMYRSGLESAGIDPDQNDGTSRYSSILFGVLALILAILMLPLLSLLFGFR